MTKKLASKRNVNNLKQLEEQLASVAARLTEAGVPCELKSIDTRQLAKFNLVFTIGFASPVKRGRLHLNLRYNKAVKEKRVPTLKLTCVHTSKKHRQAILLLQEDQRTLSRKVKHYWPNPHWSGSAIPTDQDFTLLFPIRTADGTTWKVENKKRLNHDYVTANVTALVPASEQYLLVGFDEEHMFVSMLPEPATSVEQAHDILMPDEVKEVEGVIRQGEFFLVPATKKELDLIGKEHFPHGTRDFCSEMMVIDEGLNGSDHVALVRCEIGENTYVTGSLGNRRHFNLLNGWYRVVTNRELPNQSAEEWD